MAQIFFSGLKRRDFCTKCLCGLGKNKGTAGALAGTGRQQLWVYGAYNRNSTALAADLSLTV